MCIKCAFKWLKNFIENRYGFLQEAIRCPFSNCNSVIDNARTVKNVFIASNQMELADKYERFRQSQLIDRDSNIIRCIKPDCQKVHELDRNNAQRNPNSFRCMTCDTLQCTVCLRQSHDGNCEDVPISVPKLLIKPDRLPAAGQIKNQRAMSSKAEEQAMYDPALQSFCPLCKTLNTGPLVRHPNQRVCIVQTCFFCRYEYCIMCGEDASHDVNHFGYFSDTNCGYTKYGRYKRKQRQQEDSILMATCRTLAWVLIALLLSPFFLSLFCPIMMPYILQSKSRNCCCKILLVFVGFIMGIIFTPMFIVLVLLYLITILALVLFESCNLFCSTGYNARLQERRPNDQKEVSRPSEKYPNRNRANLRIQLLSDPDEFKFDDREQSMLIQSVAEFSQVNHNRGNFALP